MYEKLTDEWIAIVNKAKETTWSNYETQGDLILIDDWKYIVDDLLGKIDELEERIEDILQDRDENWEQKEINPYTEYGVSERDFY